MKSRADRILKLLRGQVLDLYMIVVGSPPVEPQPRERLTTIGERGEPQVPKRWTVWPTILNVGEDALSTRQRMGDVKCGPIGILRGLDKTVSLYQGKNECIGIHHEILLESADVPRTDTRGREAQD